MKKINAAICTLLFIAAASADFCDNWQDLNAIDEMSPTDLLATYDILRPEMSQKFEDFRSTFDLVASDCLAQCNQNIEAVMEMSKGLLLKGQSFMCRRKPQEAAAAPLNELKKAIFLECVQGILQRHEEYTSDASFWILHLEDDMAGASRSFERCKITEDAECLQDAMKHAVDASCSKIMTGMKYKMMKCTDDVVVCMNNYVATVEEPKC